jgi:hypothetical protein
MFRRLFNQGQFASSAEIARDRLFFVTSLDRQLADGRQRVWEIPCEKDGSGRLVFIPPMRIQSNEDLLTIWNLPEGDCYALIVKGEPTR